MKYKALILDVDGTLMPNYRNAVPSKKVIDAIKKASKKIHVGIATARPLIELDKVLFHISFSGPSIINGGAQIIDLPTKKILKEQPISKDDVLAVCKLAIEFGYKEIIINDANINVLFSEKYIPKKPFQIYIPDASSEKYEQFLQHISHFSNVVAHKIVSWRKEGTDIVVTHSLSTKQHGVLEVARILGITTQEVIGVGDGYNDFPLLMACGLKIAMGNAVKEIKEIADYIAPSVKEDGLVDIIERFVLKDQKI